MKILDNLLSKFHPGTAEATPTTPKSDQQHKGRVAVLPAVEVNVDELLEHYLTERSPIVSHTSAFRVR